MADDEIRVRIGAETGPVKGGMDEAARAVREGTATMRELLEQLARGSAQQSERIAEAIERGGQRVQRSQKETADKSSAAHKAWIEGWQRSVIAWNQGLELIQKGLRAVEITYDQTMGRVVDRGAAFEDFGKRLSTDVAELTAFDLASRRAGVGLEAIGAGYRKLSAALVEAKDTSSASYRVLVQGIGLTLAELERLRTAKPHEAILTVGQALERYEDTAEKAAAGQALFGRGYGDVLQLLREGESTLRDNIALGERLGLVMSTQQAQAAGDLKDALELTGDAWLGLMTRMLGDESFLRELAGMIESASTEFADMGAEIPQEKAEAFRGVILEIAQELRNVLPSSDEAVSGLTKLAEKLQWFLDHRWEIWSALQGAALGAAAGMAGGAAIGSMVPGAGTAVGAAVGAVAGGIYGGVAGSMEGAAVDAANAMLAGATEDLADARRERAEREGITGVGMSTPEGVTIPSGSVGSPSVLPNPPPRPKLNVPDDPSKGQSAADKARRAAFEALARAQQEALLKEKDNAEARLAIVTDFSERIKARFGAESEEFAKQRLVQVRAEEDAAAQRARIAEIEANSRREASMRALEQEREDIEFRRELGIISHEQAEAELRAHLQRRLELLRQFAAEAMAANAGDPVKQAEIAAGLRTDEAEVGEQGKQLSMEQLREEVAQITELTDGLFGSIGQAADRMVEGMLQGTRRFGANFREVGRGMLSQFIAMTIQMVTRWAAAQAAKTLAAVTADQAQVASAAVAATQKGAIEATQGRKSLLTSAATAAGKAYDAMAGIPYIGPILGAIAAAATFAAVMGFSAYISAEGGAERIPAGGALAQLHPDEMVLPARIAEPVRQMARGFTGGSDRGGLVAEPMARGLAIDPGLLGRVRGGGSAPDLEALRASEPSVAHHTYEIHAVDARSFERLLDTPGAGRVMAKRVEKAVKLQQRRRER